LALELLDEALIVRRRFVHAEPDPVLLVKRHDQTGQAVSHGVHLDRQALRLRFT
jgi:hypothetical protein